MSEHINKWASRILYPDRNKSEFDKFVQEVCIFVDIAAVNINLCRIG